MEVDNPFSAWSHGTGIDLERKGKKEGRKGYYKQLLKRFSNSNWRLLTQVK